ncbi:MAG: hypothetical protein RJA10_1017 [Pseudomonadota bacterium]|jgi:hypothetical protein
MTPRRLALQAVALGLAAAAAAWAFSQWQGALRLVLLGAIVVAYFCWALPHLGVRALDRLILAARTLHWRHEQGRHHAFGGIPLQITEDHRHVWVDGPSLQRVLGTQDADDVLAARHSGRWRRNADGVLLLRVDAVVDVLAHGPGRLDPRQVHLRRFFERDVLFPAAERRRRARP